MTHFHAVMIDETGCEFGASIEASSRSAAYDRLREDYPESRCVQLESPEDTRAREQAMYDHIDRGGDWDEEGRPIFGAAYDYDEEDDYPDEEEDEDEGFEGMLDILQEMEESQKN